MWNDCHIARNSCTGTAARNSCAGTAAHHPPQRPAGCMLSALSAFPRLWLVLLGTSHGLLAAGLSAWPGRPVGARCRLEDLFREGWLSQPRRMLQRPGVPGGQGRRQRLSVAPRFRSLASSSSSSSSSSSLSSSVSILARASKSCAIRGLLLLLASRPRNGV